MKREDALYYVRDNLGIDIAASSLAPNQGSIMKIVEIFPFKGILLLTGSEHLIKAGRLCYELLKADLILGSIERFESWEPAEICTQTELLLYTNIVEDLVKPQMFINTVSDCMKNNTPMAFTTPLTVDGLEGALPLSVISNLVPYLYGKI